MSSAPLASRVRIVGLFLGLAAFAVLFWVWGGPPGKPLVGTMAALAALMSIWWMTEAVPLAVTSLLPLALFPLLGISDARRTPLNYFNEIIVLYLGGFFIALAMEQWNLHKRVALTLLARAGTTPGAVIAGFLLVTGLLSMWISNTATALMMLPIGIAVATKLEETFGADRAKPLSLGLMLAIAYGCSLGGIATLVGTPTNLAFLKIYRDTFPAAPAISFGEWMLYATPLAAVLGLATWFLLTKVFCRCDAALKLDRAVIVAELRGLGPMSSEEKRVAALFASLALLWIFRGDLNLGLVTLPGWNRLHPALTGLDDGATAMLVSLLLFFIPARSQPGRTLLDGAAIARVPWDVLLLFGGGFALAAGFVSTGLSLHLAEVLRGLGHLPQIALLLLVCVFITFLTELTSNVATATMFLPILAAWAVAEGVHPLILMIPCAVSASMAFMLPVATPPNAIVFSSRRVRIAEMAKVGLVLNLIGVAVIAVFSQWLLPLVMRFDPQTLPTWALPK
jgi:solute carrier family 13 (sodium-dependent dicarboxylate transporter), member 2/3/5